MMAHVCRPRVQSIVFGELKAVDPSTLNATSASASSSFCTSTGAISCVHNSASLAPDASLVCAASSPNAPAGWSPTALCPQLVLGMSGELPGYRTTWWVTVARNVAAAGLPPKFATRCVGMSAAWTALGRVAVTVGARWAAAHTVQT